MRIAFGAIRRAKVRFGLLTGALRLLLFPHPVPAVAGRHAARQLHRRRREPDGGGPGLRRRRTPQRRGEPRPPQQVQAAAVDGVAEAGVIGEGTFSAEVTRGELVDATVFGYELGGAGAPATVVEGRLPDNDGEAVASMGDAADGFAIGSVVRGVPGDVELEIVALAEDINFNVQPTVFVSYATYEKLVVATNSDARAFLPSLVGVLAADGIEPTDLAAAITDEVEASTRSIARPRWSRFRACRRSASRSRSSSAWPSSSSCS